MPAARNTDPLHSHLAAASVTAVSMLQTRILALFGHYGPMTDMELIHHHNLHVRDHNFPPASDSGIRSRRSELVDQGRILPTGAVAYTLTGRRTTVWAVPAIPQQRAA